MSTPRNPTEYFILIAPAVTFLLALSSRQTRISVIARENAKKITDLIDRGDASHGSRVKNLLDQNGLLFARYRLIQWALLVICVGLLVLGIDAFIEYFKTEPMLLLAGVIGMGLGTSVVLYEIARGGDTLKHELAYANWVASERSSNTTPPTKMEVWVLFGNGGVR
jgi:ABC-type amino acid transport system permease subunit